MFNDQTFTVTGIESDTVREITGQIVAVDRTTITASSEVGELELGLGTNGGRVEC